MFKNILLSAIILTAPATAYAGNEDIDKNKEVQAIDIPSQLDINYDDMLHLWATTKSNAVECEYNKEAAVLFDDSTYIRRLYSLPTQMELAYNSTVKRFIEMYADRRRGQVSYMLGQAKYYFPMFEEALDKEGLPLELKYLPVIESALNPIVRSRAGATGLWQFMPATGKMYKLEINSLVDERRDPIKSTQAAVKYLKDMYKVYGDWNLVIAAYNCGPGNVNKAIRRSGGKKDYWDIYPYLPKETRGYVPAFIAATYIMSYHNEHKICPAETNLPVLVDTLSIGKMIHFEQIADILNVSIDELRRLNPQYKEDIIPGAYKEYALKLPLHELSAFIAKEDTIYKHRCDELLTHKQQRHIASAGNAPSSGGYATYRVKSGDTMGAIALRHSTSTARLKQWNGLSSDKLRIGQTLKVSDYVAPRQTAANLPKVEQEIASEITTQDGVLKRTTTVTKTTRSAYKVQPGDTWTAIARKTGASMSDIKKWNGLRNNNLIAGKIFTIYKEEMDTQWVEVNQPEVGVIALETSDLAMILDTYIEELAVPTPQVRLGALNPKEVSADTMLEEANVIYHKVIYGETMSQIAAKYNVSVSDILSWNNITKDTNSQPTRLLIILPAKVEGSQIASKPAEQEQGAA